MPIPPVASCLGRLGLLAAALSGVAGVAQAQTPSPSPTVPNIAEDEKDFLGLTSLALGSGARASIDQQIQSTGTNVVYPVPL